MTESCVRWVLFHKQETFGVPKRSGSSPQKKETAQRLDGWHAAQICGLAVRRQLDPRRAAWTCGRAMGRSGWIGGAGAAHGLELQADGGWIGGQMGGAILASSRPGKNCCHLYLSTSHPKLKKTCQFKTRDQNLPVKARNLKL